jgi:RHS repeat-associated protein
MPYRSDPRLVGDPVDTLTGAVVDRMLDFRLTGPIELRWTRHYDSSQCARSFSVGRACAHEFDRSLVIAADGLLYEEPIRRALKFPPLPNDGDECAFHGYRVGRESANRYVMFGHAEPAMEFVFRPGDLRARLTRLLRGSDEVRFHYDAANKLIRIDDSAGRHLTAEEDQNGRLVRLAVDATATAAGYLLIAYEYDDRGNLIRTVNSEGHGYRFAYDDTNRMVRRWGRKGFCFSYKYDAQGRCVLAMGDDRLYGVALDYTVPGRLTKVTRPDRGVWTYTFAPQGWLHEIVDPLGGVQRFVRDPATGRSLQEIDPNGNLSHLVYNAAGAPVARVDPLGYQIPLPEDPNLSHPLEPPVPENPAEYEYGWLLDTAAIALPDGKQIRSLPLPREALALASMRPARPEPAEPTPAFEVPPLRMLWWPPPRTGRIFDDLGKLREQRDLFGRRRCWSYDASGNVAEYIDFDEGRWQYEYGAWHFLLGVADPSGAETRYTYTPYGKVASCTDPGGTRSDYRYDHRDRLVEVSRHGVVRERYTRDAAGNLVAKHAGDGRELLRIDIGPGNLPIRRILACGDEHRLEYDPSGRCLVAATKKDRLVFAYDPIGNRALEKRNGMGLAHRFQGWRRPAETVLFERFRVRFLWTNPQSLTILDPGGLAHYVRFLGNGIIQRRFSNGSQEIAQYDNLGRALFKCVQHCRGKVWSRRFHWSGEGELQRVEDNLWGESRHEYDAAHRLRRRHIGGRTELYRFDLAGNLLEQPGLTGVALGSGNRIESANGCRFEYNDRNHIALRRFHGKETRYSYDSRDQLVRVETPEGIWTADYDALGRRVRKVWNGDRTEYYWSGDQLVAEVGPSGQLRMYLYAHPLALTPLLFLDYEFVDAPLDSGRRCFVLADQIGTPCLLEDESGANVWTAQIAPFGYAEVGSDASLEFNLRFPGHYADSELALHYNRSRSYDPVLGRYLQSDPWGISGGCNLYAYSPNPLLKVDIFGLGEDGSPGCSSREDGAEGTGEQPPAARRRMTDEELQSAADYIRNPNGDPRDFSTLTVTEGMENGRPVYTVTSSRRPSDRNDGHNLTPGERNRAAEVFGPDARTPVEGRAPRGEGSHHSEQRGMRATEDQTDRRQASSNNTMGEEGNFGAACSPCAACQRTATNSSGEPNPVQNVTGTVEDGGRTNNPSPGAWRDWRNE